MKRTIVKDMANPDGKIRLLFATEAYGMGADAPDIRKIMHFGPPTSLESKWLLQYLSHKYCNSLSKIGCFSKSITHLRFW